MDSTSIGNPPYTETVNNKLMTLGSEKRVIFQFSRCIELFVFANTNRLCPTFFHLFIYLFIYLFIFSFLQCQRYRHRFDQIARNRMREKVTASIIFKNRKASYPKR